MATSRSSAPVTEPDSGPSYSASGDASLDGSLTNKQMRRVLASGFLGNAIEVYDFVLYANASAIVFAPLFFSNMDPVMATIASLASLAVGFLVRPLGAIFFGHFGDKVGRKSVLIATMIMMGVASTLIGLLPTYEQIGFLAPLLLIILRLLQGFAVGGEWGGGTLVALEQAPGKKRAFAASFTTMGGPAGAIMSFAALGGMALLPEEQFLAWGWRVPFLISVLLLVIGLYVRAKVEESPLYKKTKEEDAGPTRVPFAEVVTKHWRSLLKAIFPGASFYVYQGLTMTWAVAYATSHGMGRSESMAILVFGSLGSLIFTGVGARLADRFGCRKIMIFAASLGVVLAFPIFQLIQTATFWGLLSGICLGQWLVQGLVSGPFGAFLSELFPTRIRYTGISMGYQGATIIGGLTPLAAASLMLWSGGNDTTLLSLLAILGTIVTIVAVMLTVEGKDKTLSQI